jgi:uncharacterized protein YuzE
MKVTHDHKRGMSYIYLMDRILNGAAVRQVQAGPDVILDFDADGYLLGIELLDRKLLHPVLLQLATGD